MIDPSEQQPIQRKSFRRSIEQRSDLMRQIRRFFDRRGFKEVTPPCLLPECIVDASIDPIPVQAHCIGVSGRNPAVGSANENWYLQSSPELAMKGMLSAGSGSIYTITPAFRAHEWGTQHRAEFSMLEWYEVDADAEQGIATLGSLAMQLFRTKSYEVRTYQEIFRERLGIDPIGDDTATLANLVHQMDSALGNQLSDSRDDLLDVLLSHRIQPELGKKCPMILRDYPISQAALAKSCVHNPACAERFELFFHGIELANGYDELLNPDILRHRMSQANAKRVDAGKPAVATPQSLIEAMETGLPASAGVAMGVDRVLMILCDADDIATVR